MKVLEKVPYIKGLDQWIGTELNESATAYLKDFGAATASNGSVGLYHIEALTPEAKDLGDSLIRPDAQVYVIDDAELERVKIRAFGRTWTQRQSSASWAVRICPSASLRNGRTG